MNLLEPGESSRPTPPPARSSAPAEAPYDPVALWMGAIGIFLVVGWLFTNVLGRSAPTPAPTVSAPPSTTAAAPPSTAPNSPRFSPGQMPPGASPGTRHGGLIPTQ